MMKTAGKLMFLFLLLQSFLTGQAQNYIGLDPAGIALKMKTVNPRFKLDKGAVNHTYKYLKYVDKISEQTILFFMSDKNICTYVRWMSDYSNLNDMVAMLNKNYSKRGKNTWTYSDRGEHYTIRLVEEEWYFTVSFRKN